MNKKKNGEIYEAAALKFDPAEDDAPKVIAAGRGEAAAGIMKAAKEHKIPIYQDKKLAHLLSRMGIGDQIPPELYEVVAEVLVFISRMDKDYSVKADVNFE